MKIILGVSILIACWAPIGLSLMNVAKRHTPEELQKLIMGLNYFRSEVAMTYNISNMHSIRYSLQLEEITDSMKTCADVKPGANYMPFYPPDDNMWKAIHTHGFENIDQLIERGDDRALQRYGAIVLLIKEIMHPLQTTIGCSMLEKPCHLVPDNTLYDVLLVQKIEFNAICLLGPSDSMDPKTIMKGHPGRNCLTGTSENGLCTSDVDSINFLEQYGIGNDPATSFSIQKYALLVILKFTLLVMLFE
ncbi:hypothetical protein CAEBREN_21823 [Caenorhabditis brenneri]|uniref:Uncharacterized protein n=1 Tax=Caenorhabditis brenneri TaxID=135651 RepID=G0MR82_CAEBE|nr:hypothetical protein CAEBREN_21823 [Caenorhabditis brenneri]